MRKWNDRTRYGTSVFLLALLGGCGGRSINVLLITLDTTRADHLGCYGAGFAETPAIDKLAKEGVLFETVVTPVPTTLPSHTSIMTGLYPLAHGARDNGIFRVGPQAKTLAEILSDRGYRTGAVVSAFVLDSQFGLDQGFATYDDQVSSSALSSVGSQDRRAKDVTTAALAFLDVKSSAPFFLWLHYFDAHGPYEPPAPYRERFVARPYDGEIAYVDSELQRLFDGLTSRGLMDSTLIVVTADHGESLGEHGEKTHAYFIYEATARVPLIMRGPGLPSGTRMGGLASLVDVMPTILGALELEPPSGLDGQSLFGGTETRPVYLETYAPYYNFGWAALRGLRDERYKYIRAPEPELYDLTRDPGEEHNVIAEQQDVAARFSRALDNLIADHSGDTLSELNSPSPAETEKLAHLGYTAAAASAERATTGPDPKKMIDLIDQRDRGRTLLGQGRFDDAIAAFKHVLDRNPENTQVREFLGTALTAKGQWKEARDELLRAVTERPALYTAHYNLAQCYRQLNDPAQMLLHLEAAYHHNPRYLEPARDLAIAYAEKNDAKNTALWLDHCRTILGDDNPTYKDLAKRLRM
jgi:arylsulfatase A-like enzyme